MKIQQIKISEMVLKRCLEENIALSAYTTLIIFSCLTTTTSNTILYIISYGRHLSFDPDIKI